MKRLAVICARGGSKGVKGKNLRDLAGKPLVAHAIQQAKESGLFNAVAVSSDADDILAAGEKWGADHLVKRPHDLSTDEAPKLPAIRHCTETVEKETGIRFEVIADLAVTSPFRGVMDIRGAVELLESTGTSNVLSAFPAVDNPYFNIVEVDDNDRLHLSKPLPEPVLRRQNAPACYTLNGAIYVWTRASLFDPTETVVREESRLFVMPRERSLDIDTGSDFDFARFLLAERGAVP